MIYEKEFNEWRNKRINDNYERVLSLYSEDAAKYVKEENEKHLKFETEVWEACEQCFEEKIEKVTNIVEMLENFEDGLTNRQELYKKIVKILKG